MPAATYTQYRSTTACAAASPAAAASNTSLPVSLSPYPASRDSGCAAAARFPCRISAVAEAYASQQPFRPQVQSSPSSTSTVWPTSAPVPPTPSSSWPSATMPPPTPVPSVMSIMFRQPTAPPATVSASAAQLASLLR